MVTVACGVTLALAFRRASDILFTSVAPSWDEIGQLAAIAAIRPLLNYFPDREIAAKQAAARG